MPLAIVTDSVAAIPVLRPLTRVSRPLNHDLWTLLTKPGPLTDTEWEYVRAIEERAATDD